MNNLSRDLLIDLAIVIAVWGVFRLFRWLYTTRWSDGG